jgi:UDPglucose 6-dehydrogenase
VSAPLAEASDKVNEDAKLDLLEKVKARITTRDTVAVLGLSYKPDTYITEESAGLHLAQHLKYQGYHVVVHDFSAKPANSPALHEFEVIEDLTALPSRKEITLAIICCPWPQYKEVKFAPATQVLAAWQL